MHQDLFHPENSFRDQLGSDAPQKRRRMDVRSDLSPSATEEEWRDFELDINTFEAQHIHGRAKLALPL